MPDPIEIALALLASNNAGALTFIAALEARIEPANFEALCVLAARTLEF
jgi:hypothetical protein